MQVTVTGATGLIGSRVVARLKARGDEVTVLSRDPERARERLDVAAFQWQPSGEPAPVAALSSRDAVLNLVGENVAQRWSDDARRAIRATRIDATDNLVEGLRAAAARPRVLVCASAVGIYGPHGDERVDESTPPGEGFLADVCRDWETAAHGAEELGLRVVCVRTGVVLDREGGALKKMLPPFRAGVGGPVAGGRQYMPWIHVDDVAGMMLAALDGETWTGAVNATAPAPVTNREFSRALGRALRRPAFAPVPAAAMRLLYGEMAEIVTTGQRAVPARALELGYEFAHPELGEALAAALAG
jgi:uncharacterized protein